MAGETTGEPGLVVRVAAGFRWSMVDVGLQQIMRLAITIVLTRLVAPDDFGTLAMALVFTQLAALIGDLGFGPALIQRQTIERRHVVTAFTATVLTGGALSLLVCALSIPIAHFYGEPDLRPVLAVLSCSYLVRGISGVPRDLLRRKMKFKPFAISSIVAVSVSGTAGIALALAGAGVWSLVVQVLAEATIGAVMTLLFAKRAGVWAPAVGIDRSALGDLAQFGAFVSGTRVAYYGATNLDNLIVGKVLGATPLGLYNLAYRTMLFPVLKVADVVASVTMPAMASIQDDVERMARAFRRAVSYIGLVCFPVSIGTAIAAPVLVPAVFGARWLGAVTVVQILALNGVRLAIGRLNGVVYEATGRPKWDFVMLASTLAAYVLAFLVGVHWGIEGVAWGYTIAGYALVPLDQHLVNKALGTSPRYLLGGLAPVVGASAALALVAGLMMVMLPDDMASGTKSLVLVVGSAAAYLAALRASGAGLVGDLARRLAHR